MAVPQIVGKRLTWNQLTGKTKPPRQRRGKRKVADHLYPVVNLAAWQHFRYKDNFSFFADRKNDSPSADSTTSKWWITINNRAGTPHRIFFNFLDLLRETVTSRLIEFLDVFSCLIAEVRCIARWRRQKRSSYNRDSSVTVSPLSYSAIASSAASMTAGSAESFSLSIKSCSCELESRRLWIETFIRLRFVSPFLPAISSTLLTARYNSSSGMASFGISCVGSASAEFKSFSRDRNFRSTDQKSLTSSRVDA